MRSASTQSNRTIWSLTNVPLAIPPARAVPDELDGKVVKALPCVGRTSTSQGDILAPGDLLIETE